VQLRSISIVVFVLFSQNTLIKWNSSDSKTILMANNPIPLKEISVSFRKNYEINLGIGLAGEWRFRSVIVLDMQSNVEYFTYPSFKVELYYFPFLYRYTFCPTSDSLSNIKSGFSLTYQLCDEFDAK
jgi:hypothetical protein